MPSRFVFVVGWALN